MPDKIVNHFVLADGSTAKYNAGCLVNLDDTVSLAGYAPDAKAVGDRLTDIEKVTDGLSDIVDITPYATGEATTPNATYRMTELIEGVSLNEDRYYTVKVSIPSALSVPVYFYMRNMNAETNIFSVNIPAGSTSTEYNIAGKSEYTNLNLRFQAGVVSVTAKGVIDKVKTGNQVSRNHNGLFEIENTGSYTFDCGFVRTTLDGGAWQGYGNYRVSSAEIVHTDRALTLDIETGFRIGVHSFENGVFSEDSGWQTGSYVIPENTDFKLVIAKVTEDTSIPADIDEFVQAVKVRTFLYDELSPKKKFSDSYGDLFRFDKYFSHIGVDKTQNIIIPCQSVADVSRAKRLGFKVLELNVRKTSDGKYICLHGANGAFGTQFEDINGGSVTDILVNTMTLSEVKNTIRYKSVYPKYRTAPFTLQEMLYECKKQGIVPLVEYWASYDGEIDILDSIMGKNNYILSIYNDNRPSDSDAICGSWLNITEPTALVAKCNNSGGLYIAGINASDSAYSSFTDDDWKELVSAVHQAGYLISFNTGYTGEVKSQKLFSCGFDVSGSGWNINEIEYGNICNLYSGVDFSGFTTTGTVADGILTLVNGDTIAPSATINSVFLGGGSLHIRFDGTITIYMGDYIYQSYTSDGNSDMWFSTFFENSAPTFNIQATANTEVYDITYKASEM